MLERARLEPGLDRDGLDRASSISWWEVELPAVFSFSGASVKDLRDTGTVE